jgi:protocatechuate 3,4-dioxygenase, alpha subunit
MTDPAATNTATASQTIGPYWHLIEHKEWADLTRFGAAGDRIVLTGRITDGEGAPVADACVEIWQADPPSDEKFPGFGRARADADGVFRFTTIRPGPVPGRGNAQQAPHIAIAIQARGLMQALMTRAYFPGEALNETDPVLGLVEDPARRATLIATPAGTGAWRLNIRLQGEGETVFLTV